MREPGIHIKEKDLAKILQLTYGGSKEDANRNARYILSCAKNKSLSSRTIVTPRKDSVVKKAHKMTMADGHNTQVLGATINRHRVRAKHNGVRPYSEHSRDWSQLKELTSLVLKFCYDFELDIAEGMNKFVKISLNHVSQKSKVGIIGKMINTYDHVVSLYESRQELQYDDDPELTEKLFNKYKALIVRSTGIKNISFDTDEVMIYFYKMKLEAAELGVSPYTFMDAQFDQLQWTGSYPEPNQLVGQKAKQRLFKYKYEPSADNNDNGKEQKANKDVVKQLISIRQ